MYALLGRHRTRFAAPPSFSLSNASVLYCYKSNYGFVSPRYLCANVGIDIRAYFTKKAYLSFSPGHTLVPLTRRITTNNEGRTYAIFHCRAVLRSRLSRRRWASQYAQPTVTVNKTAFKIALVFIIEMVWRMFSLSLALYVQSYSHIIGLDLVALENDCGLTRGHYRVLIRMHPLQKPFPIQSVGPVRMKPESLKKLGNDAIPTVFRSLPSLRRPPSAFN